MSTEQKAKNVHFYFLRCLDKGTKSAATDVDWEAALQAWSTRRPSLKERAINDTIYDPRLGLALPALGIHRAASADFQSKIDEEGAAIDDFLDSGGSGTYVANSTAVVFLPKHNVIGIATGNPSSPRVGSVSDFAAAASPLTQGHWSYEAVLDEADLREFHASESGIRKFEGRFSTKKSLFTQTSAGIVSHFDEIADEIGGDLQIDITLTVTGAGSQRISVGKKFKGLLSPSLERIVTGERARVWPADGNAAEAMNLIAEKFVVSVPLEDVAVASRSFTQLVNAVVTAGEQNFDKIKDLVEG